jgi:hypothetical protein
MNNCLYCKKSFKNNCWLSRHIKKVHNTSFVDYYNYFFKKEDEGKCKKCKKDTKFKYSKYDEYCSISCSTSLKNEKNWKKKEYRENRLQSMKNTMITSEGISNKNIQNWKKKEYREKMLKVLEPNLFNNFQSSINWSCENFKEKMRISNLKKWENPKYRENMELKNGRGTSGKFIDSGIHFASTWEAIVIYKYLQEGKKIERCPTKYKIKYIGKDNKEHNYYPDFYIPEENLIIEVKSQWQIDSNHREAKTKIDAALNEFARLNVNYVVMSDNKIKEFNVNFSSLKENNIIEVFENKKSLASKTMWSSEEYREKVSNAQKRKWEDPEYLKKRAENLLKKSYKIIN